MKQTPKIIGAIIGIIFFIALISGFTYAWFTWISPTINVSGNTACFDINYKKGNLVTDDMLLVDANKVISNNKITIKKGMTVTNLNVSKNPNCLKIKAKLTIELYSPTVDSVYYTNGACANALNYVLVSYDPSKVSTVNASTLENLTFDIIATAPINNIGARTIFEKELADDGTSQDYLVIFYLDGNKANNYIDNQDITVYAAASVTQIN